MAQDVVIRAEGLGGKYQIGQTAERDCAHPAFTRMAQCYGGSSVLAATCQYKAIEPRVIFGKLPVSLPRTQEHDSTDYEKFFWYRIQKQSGWIPGADTAALRRGATTQMAVYQQGVVGVDAYALRLARTPHLASGHKSFL
jgi:hypothetical protein